IASEPSGPGSWIQRSKRPDREIRHGIEEQRNGQGGESDRRRGASAMDESSHADCRQHTQIDERLGFHRTDSVISEAQRDIAQKHRPKWKQKREPATVKTGAAK